MKIYLLRHGETDYNVSKQYTGTLDIPVSEIGLNKLFKADFDIDKVYVSSLQRTQQTALVLFPTAKQIIIHDLRERCFGALEGQHYIIPSDNSDENRFDLAVEGGEDRECFIKRACDAFNKIVIEEMARGTQTVVFVAHGGIQMAVLSQYATPKRAYEEWCCSNGGGFVLETEGNKLKVITQVCYSK